MTTPVAATTDAELLEVVRKAIEKAGAPLSATKLNGMLPKSLRQGAKKLHDFLEGQTTRGVLHRYAKGKSVAFGLEAPEAFARQAVLDAAGDEPESWTNLKKRPTLKAAAACLAAKSLDAARDGLRREKRIFEWPKTGTSKAGRLARRPVDPKDYLAQSGFVDNALKAIKAALKKDLGALSKFGLDDGQVQSAAMAMLVERLGTDTQPPYAPDMATLFLDRMIEEDPASAGGAPIPLRNLRRALAFQFPEKAAFDQAVLALAREGVMALHRYDYPAGLTDDERDELVSDGQGGFYLAISRRS